MNETETTFSDPQPSKPAPRPLPDRRSLRHQCDYGRLVMCISFFEK